MTRSTDRSQRLRKALAAWLAGLVCLLFAAGLSDTAPAFVAMGGGLAPLVPLPAEATTTGEGAPRDAALVVQVTSSRDGGAGDRDDGEAGSAVEGAVIRVFSILGDQAYLAGEGRSDPAGEARFDRLPRAETWVLAYGEGRARASTRAVLGQGERRVELELHDAQLLEVVAVDDEDRPLPQAAISVRTADPIPYLLVTGDGGRAVFDRLGPPPFVVSAAATGFDPAVKSGVFPGRTPLRIKLERLAAIEVVVIGNDGEPAPGATVLAAGPGLWPARSTTTNDEGKALIQGLRAGAYDLKAELGELVSRTELGFAVKSGQTEKLELSLEPGRMIDVVVSDGDIDAEGREPPGIENASVVLAPEGLSSFPLQGRTAGDGHVLLGPIAAGPATASARAPGFVPTAAVFIEADATSVRVPLKRGAVIVGRIEDDRGYPIDGATIEVVGVDDRGLPIDETSSMSEFREDHFEFAMRGPLPLLPIGELGVMPGPIPDLPRGGLFVVPTAGAGGGDPWVSGLDGAFRADPVSPGRLQVIARHPSYVDGISASLHLRSGEEAEVTIVLSEGGRLEGRVVEEGGAPVAAARVELAVLDGGIDRTTYAADDGTFAFAAVPRRVVVRVARPETPFDIAARVEVDVPPGERRSIEIVLPRKRGSTLVRVVDDRGYAVPSAEVRIASLDIRDALHKTEFTGDEGDVEIAGVQGLAVRMVIDHPLYAPIVAQVDPTPDRLKFTLASGVDVRGTITARGGRDRVAGALVALHSQGGVVRVQSDEEGDFAVPNIAPGRLRVVAHHEAWSKIEELVLVEGDDTHPFDVGELDLGVVGSVSGTVLDVLGEPVAGARVAVDAVPTYLPLGPLPPGVVTTDKDGRFELSGVREGRRTLEAYFGDLGRGWLEGVDVRADRNTDDLEIRLGARDAGAGPSPTIGSLAVTLGEAGGGASPVIVYMVPPGGEAEVAGIEPGDRLIAVNGEPIQRIEGARKLLTGPLTDDVIVKVTRDMLDSTTQSLRLRARRERVRK